MKAPSALNQGHQISTSKRNGGIRSPSVLNRGHQVSTSQR